MNILQLRSMNNFSPLLQKEYVNDKSFVFIKALRKLTVIVLLIFLALCVVVQWDMEVFLRKARRTNPELQRMKRKKYTPVVAYYLLVYISSENIRLKDKNLGPMLNKCDYPYAKGYYNCYLSHAYLTQKIKDSLFESLSPKHKQ